MLAMSPAHRASPGPQDFTTHISALLHLAMPIAVAQLAQMAMALTDSILLGGLGHRALAAGGLAVGLFFTLVVILQGAMNAASIGIAQALGARDDGRVARIVASAMLLGLLLSPPIFFALGAAEQLMRLLGEPAPLARDIGTYLSVLRWATPAALAGLGLLRAVLPAIGAAGLLLRIMPVMAVLNGLLNYGLIHGAWGLPKLGFLGSALATTLTLWVSPGALAAAMLASRARRAQLRPFVPDRAELRELLRLGAPISLTIAAEVLLFQVAGLQAGLLGAASLAAHQIALNVASTLFMVPLALSQAANVRVGFWTGAARPSEVRRSGLIAIGLTLLAMGTLALLLLALPHRIAGLYLDGAIPANQPALRLATTLLGIVALFQIVDGVQSVALGALRGTGDTAVPMLIAAAGYWLIGFPLGTIAAFRLGLGVRGLWLGIACALASVAIMTTLRFLRLTRLAGHRVERPA